MSGTRSTSRSSSSTRGPAGSRSGISSARLGRHRSGGGPRAAAGYVLLMEEVADGVLRVTFDLPLGIDHVHCYLLRSSEGGWTLVDTGLGSRDPEARWRPVLDALDAPVERIVVTHMHPDHVGGSRDVAELTGAPA